MAFVKKVAEGVTAPVKAVKSNPWALLGLAVVALLVIRFRTQIMGLLGKIPGANKVAGEG